MKISRRYLLSTSASLTAGAALPSAPAMASSPALNFVSVGDWGRMGKEHQTDVAVQMGKTAADIGSQFTISTGDNFYENGVKDLNDPHWQGSFETIYTAASLQSPWKLILGNHDYRGNVQAQLDYGATHPRWQMPARYFKESMNLPDGGVADFFYIDTSPFIQAYVGTKVDISGQNTAAQLAWLDAALGQSTATWKIVVGHHPIYTAVTGDDHDQPDLIARLDPVLRKHDIKIYINGHDHALQSVTMNGLTYVTNGAGSQTYDPGVPGRDGFVSGAHGFMTVALTSQKLDYSLIDMTGNVLFAQTITRA
ncbi:MAG: acid phosphatase [Acidocella sp. 20-57-95]|nr:MAG: acid phosphatase [Acidocella sp. 20-57-95]OYV62211.1 MAG: acid phosphatase [Acidocella sp. 21-58-7]HQT63751.1 tartrate-resistant acid phosphatase type 5 family protein [Acidocella sp.]HQU03127.1 tartrate-resistant acid phosphatase type 5 family protein [Acidocella sp.]